MVEGVWPTQFLVAFIRTSGRKFPPMWSRVLLFPIAFSVLILNAAPLKAGEWPKDYIVREDSESPDGRYARLVQTADAADQQNSNESDVYLADVKARTTLGSIE